MTVEPQRLVSPEWVVAGRADAGVDTDLQEGWGVSPAPLARGLAFTDFSSHQMSVPAGDSEEAKAVRLHEMLHARISPTQVPRAFLDQVGVSANAIRIAEEMRVNYLGRALTLQGLDPAVGDVAHLSDGTEKALADECVKRDNWNDALSLFMLTYNTKVNAVVKRRLNKNPHWKENIAFIEKELKNKLWKITNKTYFEKSVRSIKNTHPNGYQWVEKSEIQQAFIPSGFINHSIPLATLIDQWTETPPIDEQEAKEKHGVRRRHSDGHNYQWEELRFGITSLTENTGTFIGKRKRPAMVGKYPSRPDRLLTDPERRIFRETVKGKGGIVIFDCSGSMGVVHETVRQAVKQFAGALVVVYSHSTIRSTSPNAWVVAKNGRMISEHEFDDLPLNAGNGVDGPILRWAIRQRKNPKDFILWVSDGRVTGKGDDMSDNLVRECAQLSMKHNIIGVDDCPAAIELLANMKRTGGLPRNKYCSFIGAWVNTIKDGKKKI